MTLSLRKRMLLMVGPVFFILVAANLWCLLSMFPATRLGR